MHIILSKSSSNTQIISSAGLRGGLSERTGIYDTAAHEPIQDTNARAVATSGVGGERLSLGWRLYEKELEVDDDVSLVNYRLKQTNRGD